MQASQKIGEMLYKEQAAPAGSEEGVEVKDSGKEKEDNVVDAEVVDDASSEANAGNGDGEKEEEEKKEDKKKQ